jgi:Uma2 family endonuclease
MQALKTSDQVDFSRHYTLEEFCHYELIKGRLHMVPGPNPPHGDLTSDLAKALFKFLYVNNVDGKVYFPKEPVYLRAEGSTYLEPDLMYVSKALRE